MSMSSRFMSFNRSLRNGQGTRIDNRLFLFHTKEILERHTLTVRPYPSDNWLEHGASPLSRVELSIQRKRYRHPKIGQLYLLCNYDFFSGLPIPEGLSLAFLSLYGNTMVLLPYTSTRSSRCHLTARASTVRSTWRPSCFSVSTSSWCVTRCTSCSMIGPASSSSVT